MEQTTQHSLNYSLAVHGTVRPQGSGVPSPLYLNLPNLNIALRYQVVLVALDNNLCRSRNYLRLPHTIKRHLPTFFGVNHLRITDGFPGTHVQMAIEVQERHDKVLKERVGDVVVNISTFQLFGLLQLCPLSLVFLDIRARLRRIFDRSCATETKILAYNRPLATPGIFLTGYVEGFPASF